MKIKIIVAFLLFLNQIYSIHAQQDKHYSLFNESQLNINPASAGFFEDHLRLATGYRSQWLSVSAEPYRTITASADWRMLDETYTGEANFLGAGITFFNDAAGVSNYTTNIIAVPISYAIQIGEADHIAFGIQPAFFQRTITGDNLTWDNQWTGSSFNQEIGHNEDFFSKNMTIIKFDMAAGIYWQKRFSRDKKINLGIAGEHLTKQIVSVFGAEDKLFRKLTLHGQGEFGNEYTNITFMPGFYGFIQGPNKALTLGSNFRFQLKGASRSTAYFDNVKLNIGGYFRIGDALIANAILELSKFSIGASYDINVSSLNTASNSIGAMEFFLRYRFVFGDQNLRHNRIQK